MRGSMPFLVMEISRSTPVTLPSEQLPNCMLPVASGVIVLPSKLVTEVRVASPGPKAMTKSRSLTTKRGGALYRAMVRVASSFS